MKDTEHVIKESIAQSTNRFDLWIRLLKSRRAKRLAELGVAKGSFASTLLRECGSIEKYYMIDPWRHLEDWNKPANKDDDRFEQFLTEAKSRTAFAAKKRIILRGTTTEVIGQIPDAELDFAYVDGDHTLRGISIDLIRLFPKVRVGGWIGGDDFSRTIWQHPTTFEPTLVFPFSVYFAEAVGARIYALPYDQFLMEKSEIQQFAFIDLTGRYDDFSLREQFHPDNILKLRLAETFPLLKEVAKKVNRIRAK